MIDSKQLQKVYIASVNFLMEDMQILGVYKNIDDAIYAAKNHEDYKKSKEYSPEQWSDRCVFYAHDMINYFFVEEWKIEDTHNH